MHIVARQQRLWRLPAVVVMLRIRQTQVCLTHLQAEPQHDVVRGEPGARKVIVIEVLPDPVKLARCHRQLQAQFRQSETLKRIGQRLILLHAPAGHEPEALCRTVGSFPQQELAAFVLHDQIN